MSKTIFTVKERPNVPLEAEVFTPDVIAPLTRDEVCALPVFLGKRQYRMDDFFEIVGAGSDDLELHGDAGRVKWIGRGMTRGRITIHGDAGMHLGAYLKGGTIEVTGNASDWVGAEMKGGLIRIRGNAGANEARSHRREGAGARLRRPSDERRNDFSDEWRGDPYRCLDGPGDDRLLGATPTHAYLFLRLCVQPRVCARLREEPSGHGFLHPL